MKIQHSILGEFQLEISLNNIVAIIDNSRIVCSLYKIEKRTALKFYVDKLIRGKKTGGIVISESEYEAIKLEQKELDNLEKTQKYNEFLLKEKVCYHTSYNFFTPKGIEYSEAACDIVKKNLDNDIIIKKEHDIGDYSISYTYEITGQKLLEMLEIAEHEVNDKKLAKDKIENDKKAEIYLLAKKTGEKQLLYKWSESCNDKNEECDIDNLYQYVMPDGTLKIERHHTW